MKPNKEKKFSAREIGESLNNALLKSLTPASLLTPMDDKRRRKIRNFGDALTKITFQFVEEGIIKAEELVAVYAGAALFTQLKYVMHTDKMPMAKEAAAMVTAPEEDNGTEA